MFPVSEVNFLARKTGVLSHSGHKIAAVIVLDFGKGGFDCDGGDGDMALR